MYRCFSRVIAMTPQVIYLDIYAVEIVGYKCNCFLNWIFGVMLLLMDYYHIFTLPAITIIRQKRHRFSRKLNANIFVEISKQSYAGVPISNPDKEALIFMKYFINFSTIIPGHPEVSFCHRWNLWWGGRAWTKQKVVHKAINIFFS